MPQLPSTIRLYARVGASLLLVMLVASCRLVQSAADVPGHAVRAVTPGGKDKETVDPVAVEQTLLRIADGFSKHMVFGIEQLRYGTNTIDQKDVLRWKLAISSETLAIASGPNAFANTLDMTVFVMVMGTALEDYWEPQVFGESAQAVVSACRTAETNMWQLLGSIIPPQQQAELRAAIKMFYLQNPMKESIIPTRAVGIAARAVQGKISDSASTSSVLSLLRVDPLAGLDPAVREIAETRLFAERALYVAQKMPSLLRWQTELFSLNALELPAMRQLVTNTTDIAASVDRFAAVAEKLPTQVSQEREEILKALEEQETQLRPLVQEVRDTLAHGTAMSTSLNTTLTTFDALMKRFGVGQTNRGDEAQADAEPFRIQDYGEVAAQLDATALQLTELLVTLDRTIGSTNLTQLAEQVAPAMQQAQIGSKAIVDYAFWKGLILVGVIFVAALIYRWLTARLAEARSK